MNISDAKQEKFDLEDHVLDLIEQFEVKTGLSVASVTLQITSNSEGQHVTGVAIEVKL